VTKARPAGRRALSRQALRTRRKFLHHFPGGFRDETYLDWERGYKWNAHQQWEAALNEAVFARLIKDGKFEEIAATAIRIESRTNLLFSFEKMALRDAVRFPAGAKAFSLALFDLLHGSGTMEDRFSKWIEAVDRLPPAPDARPDLAAGDGVRIYRATANALLSQAHRDARSRAPSWR
jgi:hypothetical protein